MFNEIIFDLETKELFKVGERKDPSKLGVSIVSCYIRKIDENYREIEGEMKSFMENDFNKLWDEFSHADRIVGFNNLGFDMPALQPYCYLKLDQLPNFDILEEIRKITNHRYSLNNFALNNLRETKSDIGVNAVTYWKNGDRESLEKLRIYCEQDVMITKKIYDLGLEKRILKYKDNWNNLLEVEVDFSYKNIDENTEHVSLF